MHLIISVAHKAIAIATKTMDNYSIVHKIASYSYKIKYADPSLVT